MKPLLLTLLSATLAAACSSQTPSIGAGSPGATASGDVAVRQAPVVAGRPARVFIFAGLGNKCEQLPAPQISVTAAPTKGDVSFVPGQDTTIETSVKGTCVGKSAKGTGVYYTARAGQTGTDTFAVTAKLGAGESATRTFQVTITD